MSSLTTTIKTHIDTLTQSQVELMRDNLFGEISNGLLSRDQYQEELNYLDSKLS